MPEHQPLQDQPQAAASIGMPEADAAQRLKTLAVRIDEGLHAQLRFIAQLNGSSLSDEIRTALEARVTSAQDDPDLIGRAQQARSEIEREAAARTAAIAGFIGKPALEAAATPATQAGPKMRRSASKPSGE